MQAHLSMQFCRWIDPLSLQQNQCHAWKIWHHSRKIVAIPQKINVIPAKAGISSTRMKPH
jgi:hypothetical protein